MSRSAFLPACRPFTQPYDRAELVADGLVHLGSIAFAVAGVILLLSVAKPLPAFQETSVWVYGASLVIMFGISAAYNLWPVSSTKLILRRFDHATIYLFIAATYTAFIAHAGPNAFNKGLLVVIWVAAGAGAFLKLAFPARFERFGILLCLALGWNGVVTYDTVIGTLPGSTVSLIVAGGILYSLGVIFHLWDQLRFQNAIWHAFVVSAAGLQFLAVFNWVSIAGSAIE